MVFTVGGLPPAPELAVPGALRQRRPILPVKIRQTKSNATTGAAITLDTAPLLGSVLVAIAFSNQTSVAGSCSGGGVTTWNEVVRRVTGSSSGTTLNMWCGIVDTTPSATVTATTTGTNYRSRCVEFSYSGLKTGTIRQVDSAGAQANESDTAAFAGVVDPEDGGLVVAGYSALSGTGTLPGGLSVAIGGTLSSREGYIFYLPHQYLANEPIAFSMFASGGRVNVALAIVD